MVSSVKMLYDLQLFNHILFTFIRFYEKLYFNLNQRYNEIYLITTNKNFPHIICNFILKNYDKKLLQIWDMNFNSFF